jgi:hypothetical protein
MTKMNYTRVRQENQAQRYGRDFGDDMPAFGSWADQQRVESESSNARPVTALSRVRGPVPKVKYQTPGTRPSALTKCDLCGQMIKRMSRHLAKAHGIHPGLPQVKQPLPACT